MRKKFVLDFPITRDGAIIRAVMVRGPTAEDLAAVAPGWRPGDGPPENVTDAILAMVQRLTDLPPELVDELDTADIVRLSEMFGGLSNFQEKDS